MLDGDKYEEINSEQELFEKLQAEIIEDARRHYSEPVVERWLNPINLGQVENPDGSGRVNGICGDIMEVSLRIKNDKILEAKFMTEGCGPTLAAGSMATELALGKTVSEAFKIDQGMILSHLEGLPEESEHCAQLAVDTLQAALKKYIENKQAPWKTLYQK